MVGGWNAILYYKVSAKSLYYTRKSVSFKKSSCNQSVFVESNTGFPRSVLEGYPINRCKKIHKKNC